MAPTTLTLLDSPETKSSDLNVIKPVLPTIGWLAIGGGTLVSTGTITYYAYVWLVAADAAKVGALGTALGIGGLVSAFVGFGLTIWQLIQTAKAADAAAEAVRNVKRDYGSFDAMAELASARGLNESIRASLASQDREAAKVRYDRLRESLVKVASSPHALQAQVSSQLKDDAAIVIGSLGALREIEILAEIPWNEMISQLEKLDSYLISVGQRLKETIHGR